MLKSIIPASTYELISAYTKNTGLFPQNLCNLQNNFHDTGSQDRKISHVWSPLSIYLYTSYPGYKSRHNTIVTYHVYCDYSTTFSLSLSQYTLNNNHATYTAQQCSVFIHRKLVPGTINEEKPGKSRLGNCDKNILISFSAVVDLQQVPVS